jgi:hypothetical protein
MTSIVGVQPIKLTLYLQQNLNREVIITMEVLHAKLVTLGSEANKWIAEYDNRHKRPSDNTVKSSKIDLINENKSHMKEEQRFEQFDGLERNEDLEVADALELDERQLAIVF